MKNEVHQYRKKPVIIEAIQFVYQIDIVKQCLSFTGGMLELLENGEYCIKTLEGDMKVSENDFIIKGVKGEFYPCKPDIFEATYEEV